MKARWFTRVACVVCASWGVSAEAQDAQSGKADAVRQLATALERHAERCRADKLYGERKRALEVLVVLRPDDTSSLRALGYTKGSQGRWMPPKNDRQPRDADGRALDEARARFDEMIGNYVDALDSLVASRLLSDEDVVADLRRVAPDHARVHVADGEVLWSGEWVLDETLASLRRRAEIVEWTRKSFETAPEPSSVTPNARETALGLAWTDVLESDGVRVLGTVERRELFRMARSVLVTRELFRRLFGREVALRPGTTIFLLDGAADRDRFLRTHPVLTDRQRTDMARLTGAWIQGDSDDVAYWHVDGEHRLDGVIHLVCHAFLRQGFGLPMERAWEQEGLALVLTECVLGTRLTWCSGAATVTCGGEQAALRERLLESADWLAEAARRSPLALDVLSARRWGEFTPEDQLCAYALADYLVEGQCARAPRFLQYLAGGQRSTVAAVEAILGRTSAELDQRFQRWLRERPTRALEAATR